MFTCLTHSPEETAALAELVGQRVHEGTVICLEGDLGAGKTLFVQSFARTLGVEGEVTSPTFNLMNIYEGICPIYHFDLYRLESEQELEEIGFYEYTDEPEGIVLIEWADKFPDSLPEDYVRICISRGEGEETLRTITFSSVGEAYQAFVKELSEIVYLGD
ncbi:MAG: tRNA (adenosine(37)-N6)-threonylcarbamoyltransferase complex ATPase subunit type 1 TsaE [Selenomonas sp.]|jgi:tRNA threonylcarbamoyladenosine biosynthesis protein TsaE|nr:tRNA (adenosine(37)-N6)-threonylcarbamoyltransferase complex ATPase subunit type 1 TsaE [Selenomonas sp.]MCI7330309.1 tRNA (adenosine(37)-N6)-threonylcarbamoyltransferase complex ATPase subunit type 1 TsaE [Selenomonadaceae bacterium]MDD7056678.1 tRNA (adenosine(37)-N6)-threonylcarbamoyltransferase complex ATPase subunit type 1 TsaE [Selenomonadaceae bacterium]MDY3916190.1 tRNA (adenosine(37)-N6)-threonylcarbamoyltransferase complex ATPase subunit type 1 TsaE [Selenomonadaceae bacterium]HBT7